MQGTSALLISPPSFPRRKPKLHDDSTRPSRSLPAPAPPVIAAAPEQEEQYNDDEEGFHGGVAPFRIGSRARAVPGRGTTRNSRKPFVDVLSAVETAIGAVGISTICETKLLTQRWLGRAGSLAVVRPPAAYGPGPPRPEPSTRGSFRKRVGFSNLNRRPVEAVAPVCACHDAGNSHCTPTGLSNSHCHPIPLIRCRSRLRVFRRA